MGHCPWSRDVACSSRAPSGRSREGSIEARTPVLSDADQLYFERLALDRNREVTLRLSYRLGTTEWTSEGHGLTVIAAHAALREQLVLDRIRVGVRALIAATK